MCRLIIATKDAIQKYDEAHGLLGLLSFLEMQCGGQGNGVALFENGALKGLIKAVNMNVSECAAIMRECAYDTVIFHTRIASVGVVTDDQCHPFVSNIDGTVLAMNGTLYDMQEIANSLNETDTQTVLRIASTLDTADKKAEFIKDQEAVFVGMIDGMPFVSKNGGALVKWGNKKDFFYVSDLPITIPKEEIKRLPSDFWLWRGKVGKGKPKKPAWNSGWTFRGNHGIARYGMEYEGYDRDDDQWETVEFVDEKEGVPHTQAYWEGYSKAIEDARYSYVQVPKEKEVRKDYSVEESREYIAGYKTAYDDMMKEDLKDEQRA